MFTKKSDFEKPIFAEIEGVHWKSGVADHTHIFENFFDLCVPSMY